MKTRNLFPLLFLGALAVLWSAIGQQLPPPMPPPAAPPTIAGPGTNTNEATAPILLTPASADTNVPAPLPPAAADTNTPAAPVMLPPPPPAVAAEPVVITNAAHAVPPAPPVPEMATTNVVAEPPLPPLKEGELRLNFRNAPIGLVLNYLSDAAGFIIEIQTPLQGTVDVYCGQPVTKEEALDILSSALNKNGYAAIRTGRKLKIVSKTEAVRGNIPVRSGNDPQAIPDNDEIVTQIIPIRFVEAVQLAKDLSPLVSPQAMVVANEAANSIAITDTQSNIRHLVEIIRAIDSSAEDETLVRVFKLEHADPTEMASLLTGLFPEQGTSGAQSPVRFGGRGGGPLSSFISAMTGAPGGGRPSGDNQQQRIRKRMQVIAVPDPRTSSVVVTATKGLMDQIAEMIQQLDHPSPKESKVQVFHLENADPQEVANVLQDMFQTGTTRGSTRSSTRSSTLQNRVQQGQTTTGGTRTSSGIGSSSRSRTSSSF